jgi:hypothetical protein
MKESADIDEWTRLASRIRGLTRAGELCASLLPPGNDSVGAIVGLGKHASSVLQDLVNFGANLDESQKAAKRAIQAVESEAKPLLSEANATSASRQIYIRSALVMLAAIEVELSYLIFDRQSEIRSRTERAFEHLQRLIVVDETVRARWKRAYEAGEIECEKLGAVHLLAHGIWAFKANASGGRTDLVYQEPLADTSTALRTAVGLVLTEWKVLRAGESADSRFESARSQLRGYAAGVLAGIELALVRYSVLVSRQQVELPGDVQDKGVIYRHINTAVEPRTPSRT